MISSKVQKSKKKPKFVSG